MLVEFLTNEFNTNGCGVMWKKRTREDYHTIILQKALIPCFIGSLIATVMNIHGCLLASTYDGEVVGKEENGKTVVGMRDNT